MTRTRRRPCLESSRAASSDKGIASTASKRPHLAQVVKANLSMPMADNLVASIKKSFAFLDAHGAGFNSHPHHAHQPHHKAC